MCTVSFLPTRLGFILAMNRDEQKSRPRARAPRCRKAGLHTALYPSEPSGGTWTGVNDAGIALALINWYAKPQRDRALCISRGVIIPRLLAVDDLAGMTAIFSCLPLPHINPFRLIAVCATERVVWEWRWDGTVLDSSRHGWKRRHWFSSGHDEALVSDARAAAVRQAAKRVSAQTPAWLHTPAWLRKLHQSHQPLRGASSICMHRDDAQTVSYTQITATARRAQMRYAAGPPCTKKPGVSRSLSFSKRGHDA